MRRKIKSEQSVQNQNDLKQTSLVPNELTVGDLNEKKSKFMDNFEAVEEE